MERHFSRCQPPLSLECCSHSNPAYSFVDITFKKGVTMKKRLFLSAIVFILGIFALSPLSASAHELSGKSVAQSTQHNMQRVVPAVSCTDDGCDGLSPVSTGCVAVLLSNGQAPSTQLMVEAL